MNDNILVLDNPTAIDWKHVLYPHADNIGHIDVMGRYACALYYPYFAWNSSIYHTATMQRTNLTVNDIM